LVTVGVVVALVVAFFVADAAAKSYAEGRVKAQLVSSLGLTSSRDVSVGFGNGSFLLQALAGRIDVVDITVPKLSFGTLVGSATAHATQVPWDGSKPLQHLDVSFAVPEGDLGALAKNLSGVNIDSITLRKPEIVATANVAVLGTSVPVGIGITPSVSAGQLAFASASIQVAGVTFTAEQLRSNPLFGRLAGTLLTQQSFCVAKYLPKTLTASSVTVTGSALVLRFTGNGATLDSLQTKGTCP
jgi:hypothetical protein